MAQPIRRRFIRLALGSRSADACARANRDGFGSMEIAKFRRNGVSRGDVRLRDGRVVTQECRIAAIGASKFRMHHPAIDWQIEYKRGRRSLFKRGNTGFRRRLLRVRCTTGRRQSTQ
jgi:hypothetical protein